jgi:hypothetical protein
LDNCRFKTFPNTLVQLGSLKLIDCNDINSLVLDLPSLVYLKVDGCKNLDVVHLTAVSTNDRTKNTTVAEVKLSECPVERVTISRRVKDLRLVSCTELVYLTLKNNIGTLSITDCPKLKGLKALAPINNLVFSDKDNLQDDYSLNDYEDDDGANDQSD